MKKSAGFFFALAALLLMQPAWAARDAETTTDMGATSEPVPIDLFTMENSAVFESDLNHGGSFGQQYEIQNGFEYGHRFQINGNWYAHAGIAYNRFDFGNTTAPVPVHLQSGAAVIGFEYMKGEDIGAILQFRPGFYTEEHLGLNSFDCPIILGRFWVLQPDKTYLFTGAYARFLRGGFPVIPLVGLVWKPNEQFRLMALLPEPRAIYSVNDQLEIYVGGEINGGAFRTDHHDEFQNIPHVAKLSGTQVDYSDYRAGAGMTYKMTNQFDLDLGAGYAIQRSFNFHRAGETYRTDPAPFVRFELKAKF
jgi:opacity protein-like surface antigen